MKRLILTEPVTITGPDCFGRNAWLSFVPSSKPGWYWRPHGNSRRLIEIDWRIARYHRFPGLIYLFDPDSGAELYIYEHIGSIKLVGLDGVIISGSSWPPYHGRPLEVYELLRPHLVPGGGAVEWIRPAKSVEWRYSNGREGYVRIEPHEDASREALDVHVEIDYRNLGRQSLDFSFPSNGRLLYEMFAARAQGWPPWRYHLSKLMSLFGWQHFRRVTWPQELPSNETLLRFAFHRVGDCAGGFSLVSSRHLPNFLVTTYLGGHEGDLGAIRRLHEN